MPCITELHNQFYKNKTKIVPLDIYNLLDPIALAYLICGDGSVSKHGLILCTDSFPIIDIVRLINVLIIKYNLECTLKYHTPTHPRIYIREKSINLLRSIVKPYIHSSMGYKLKLNKKIKTNLTLDFGSAALLFLTKVDISCNIVTDKLSYFLIFKICYNIIKNKEHLTKEGILNLVGLKSSLNWGLTDKLMNAFPNFCAIERPDYSFKCIPDPNWLAGRL